MGLAVLPDSALVLAVGSKRFGGIADCWLSHDEGSTWTSTRQSEADEVSWGQSITDGLAVLRIGCLALRGDAGCAREPSLAHPQQGKSAAVLPGWSDLLR